MFGGNHDSLKFDPSRLSSDRVSGARTAARHKLDRYMDRRTNSYVRERCGLRDVVTRVEKGMLLWFGHLERTDKRRSRNKCIERMCVIERSAGGALENPM
ncbi:hypothetical protein EVAR_17643_1 [Eumeta japonica]|uniref:Uncharacterized protein n=1 Tax=Eumeta variegata TaxID=151549 RepID=A0A4C1URM8_EUMVA|nr:hypothetical protein EVAR_17643_1 [Eumeta japonica]